MVKELDFADNKKINYSEFIAATINAADFLTHEKLEAIFKSFDIDNTGEITAQNLKDAFSKFGKEVSENASLRFWAVITRFLNLVRRFRMMKLILL